MNYTNYKNDSARTLKLLRVRQFGKTKLCTFLAILSIPLILLSRTKRSKSVIIVLSLISTSAIYV